MGAWPLPPTAIPSARYFSPAGISASWQFAVQ